MLELKSSYHYLMGDLGNEHPSCELSLFWIEPSLQIGLLFYHIGGAIVFVPPVGLGVDEGTLDCKLLLVLLIRKLLPWLRTLVELVAFFVSLRASHGGPLLKLLHHVFTVILRRLDIALHAFAL